MFNHDMIVVTGGTVSDRFATGIGNPSVDAMQDVTLVSTTPSGGNTIYVVKRNLVTGDASKDEVVQTNT
jgi:hypothetical protein